MRIGNRTFDTANHTYVMGILNVTPDSFSDGGSYNQLDLALKHVEEMMAQGADIIDVGGESTRPGYTKISDEEEIERAMKINPRIIGVNNRNLKDFSITLETTKRLRPYIPKDKVFVTESGVMGDGDVRFLHECQVDAFLIGRAFMEAENSKALAHKWKEIFAKA